MAIAVISLRRIPSIVALYKLGALKPCVTSLREALFMGYFGPIGVSALFYLHIALEYLEVHMIDVDAPNAQEARNLYHLMHVIVWFVVVSSVVSCYLGDFKAVLDAFLTLLFIDRLRPLDLGI